MASPVCTLTGQCHHGKSSLYHDWTQRERERERGTERERQRETHRERERDTEREREGGGAEREKMVEAQKRFNSVIGDYFFVRN